MELAIKTVLLLCISCIAITMQNANQAISKDEESMYDSPQKNYFRNKRAILKQKTGPVRQIFGLLFEQWNDTRLTVNSINDLVNDNFLPENPSLITTTTPTPNLNVSTKPPPFKITRSEAARIFKRNLKGLARLLNLELRDAFKQSKVTNKEFKKNFSQEISKFL